MQCDAMRCDMIRSQIGLAPLWRAGPNLLSGGPEATRRAATAPLPIMPQNVW